MTHLVFHDSIRVFLFTLRFFQFHVIWENTMELDKQTDTHLVFDIAFEIWFSFLSHIW